MEYQDAIGVINDLETRLIFIHLLTNMLSGSYKQHGCCMC